MAHTISVTRIVDDPNAETEEPEYTIEGSCDSRCQAYRECLKDWHRHPSEEYGHREGEWSTKRVPEVHTFISGTWMTPDGCGLQYAWEDDNPDFQMTELGVYDVDVDWDGDYWLARLTLRVPEVVPHD